MEDSQLLALQEISHFGTIMMSLYFQVETTHAQNWRSSQKDAIDWRGEIECFETWGDTTCPKQAVILLIQRHPTSNTTTYNNIHRLSLSTSKTQC